MGFMIDLISGPFNLRLPTCASCAFYLPVTPDQASSDLMIFRLLNGTLLQESGAALTGLP
jgi:hypothetical protein